MGQFWAMKSSVCRHMWLVNDAPSSAICTMADGEVEYQLHGKSVPEL